MIEYAPISASSEQARRGEVTSIVGGSPDAFEAWRDLFDCMIAVYWPRDTGKKTLED